MFKKIVVLALSLSFGTLMAQKNPCQIRIEEELVSKVKGYSSKDLIPYYSLEEGKWGYMDRQSKKVLTKGFLNDPEFFDPNIMIPQLYFEEGGLRCTGVIEGSKYNYDISKIKELVLEEPTVEDNDPTQIFVSYLGDDLKLVNKEISGFVVDHSGRLIAINPKFYDKEKQVKTIQKVFPYKDAYFAIVKNRNKEEEYYSIVDQDGSTVKGFEYIDSNPERIESPNVEENLWISYRNNEDKNVVKDFATGEIKVVLDSYLRTSDSVLGYTIATVDNQKGILDMLNMRWKALEFDENDFLKLYYSLDSYKSVFDGVGIENKRKNSYIYILNYRTKTFYDFDMKEYKPNK